MQGEESKERDVEDGWVDTEAPASKDVNAGREAADIDDEEEMKMENVGGNEEEEAVS